MKKLLVAAALVLGLTTAGVVATPSHVAHATASYCSDSAYDTSYRKVYEYPSGSYWQNQIKAYPAYYQANDAYYRNAYGC